MTALSPAEAGGRSRDMTVRVVPRSHFARWVGVAAVLLFAVWIVYQVFTNPGFQWDIVGKYMFHPRVLRGVVMTCQLTFLVMFFGTIVGIVVALMRLSQSPILSFCANGYLWFFRGTPVLVQLVFWFNLASLFPEIQFGIPFDGPKFYSISSTVAISSFMAAMLGLSLNEGAYMSEIVRGGILSVDSGQSDAAKALGYRPFETFWVIVLPQAMKAIVPPTGNQVIGMLKFTSLASIVALQELMHSVESIYTRTFETIPLLIVAALWYLILVSVLSIGQHFIESYYSRGWKELRLPVQA
ncbi:MAG: amino acid ABC transporter permease [Alphaproteobacteria bacterium]|nr:amino acid ABC transporter permease [Alphaproteobacteria bacterium]